eukprot:4866187-Karenia_brevis.AAC.1
MGPWAQVGWAAMQCEPGNEETPSLVVASPMECQLPVQKRIKRSELMAFLHVLRNGLPPISYVTDHKPIVEGLIKGEAWCTAATRAHADVWRS